MIKGGPKKDLQGKQIQSILISQPKPETEKSPYFDLAKKFNIKLDFFPFIRVEGLPAKEFRKQKIDILSFTAVIFTSRNSVDHFFRICEEMKIKVSQDCKYFCITEAVALYLQKFILYRKRKVFYGADGSTKGVLEVMNKHRDNEKFLFPSSDSQKKDIEEWLKANKCEYATATLYKTVSTDVKEVLAATNYDMIVFFSPSGVKSLFENVPLFEQNGTRIGAFGPTTSAAVEEAGLRLDVKAPAPQAPSMVAALEQYLTTLNKK
ncbi:uroporphyrinogen-III synthase [Chitinophaga nivalis]|uniref:Uroporphyrinogen-III synthase n=1 Tax=Chitinophaga nivalis TaxID=2991709 RepID=A0ABT3IUF5_9BACT|nr:uroporphyrinogen-III synthase [Chitinophaga nivalis]MCW3462688.1 uroporphyrinogen-III synthase [Chitinophaga nivalis]MCW3487621.1 uroporphyrinogen-III synthase [Chitinophaga nivalis]